MKQREKDKLKKLQDQIQPTLEEQTRFKEELDHELKNNPLYKQNQQL